MYQPGESVNYDSGSTVPHSVLDSSSPAISSGDYLSTVRRMRAGALHDATDLRRPPAHRLEFLAAGSKVRSWMPQPGQDGIREGGHPHNGGRQHAPD